MSYEKNSEFVNKNMRFNFNFKLEVEILDSKIQNESVDDEILNDYNEIKANLDSMKQIDSAKLNYNTSI